MATRACLLVRESRDSVTEYMISRRWYVWRGGKGVKRLREPRVSSGEWNGCHLHHWAMWTDRGDGKDYCVGTHKKIVQTKGCYTTPLKLKPSRGLEQRARLGRLGFQPERWTECYRLQPHHPTQRPLARWGSKYVAGPKRWHLTFESLNGHKHKIRYFCLDVIWQQQ